MKKFTLFFFFVCFLFSSCKKEELNYGAKVDIRLHNESKQQLAYRFSNLCWGTLQAGDFRNFSLTPSEASVLLAFTSDDDQEAYKRITATINPETCDNDDDVQPPFDKVKDFVFDSRITPNTSATVPEATIIAEDISSDTLVNAESAGYRSIETIQFRLEK